MSDSILENPGDHMILRGTLNKVMKIKGFPRWTGASLR